VTPLATTAILSGQVSKLETAGAVADQYGLLDSIEKIAKREKNTLRGVVEKKSNPLWYGDYYVLHVLRRVDHPSVKYSKVVEDLFPLVDPVAFERIKNAHTSRSVQFTLRAEKA